MARIKRSVNALKKRRKVHRGTQYRTEFRLAQGLRMCLYIRQQRFQTICRNPFIPSACLQRIKRFTAEPESSRQHRTYDCIKCTV